MWNPLVELIPSAIRNSYYECYTMILPRVHHGGSVGNLDSPDTWVVGSVLAEETQNLDFFTQCT